MIRAALLAALLVAGVVPAAHAVQPDEVLADPALEARAREISKDLRCLVCQNQSIDDSDADLAKDLRVLVRERLTEGDSNAEVKDYIVARYGDFVLLTPPFKAATFFLWFGPVLFLVCAVVIAGFTYRRHAAPTPATATDLDDDERARLAALTGDKDGGEDK